ncbi:amino acid/amide ABC transporter membrane protein 2, HAAT family [Polaromonas sp. JS666]|nr:amino acid/amide ABC transporter membrane protein 2, HAAT family [Polaromonas sp. JS666]
MCAIPLFIQQKYLLHVISLAMIFGIAALSLQLLLGFTGLLSMGQAAFLGVGAYTAGILAVKLQYPFLVCFVAAGVVSGLISLILVPITRLKGVYLSVATLGFTIAIHLVFLNEEWLTGGSQGLSSIPPPAIGSLAIGGEQGIYYLCLAVAIGSFAAFHLLVSSRFGRALQAIKLDEDAARASGINVTLYKSQAFVTAAVFTGWAGALFTYHNQYLNPNDFTFWKSIEIVIMVAVGGIGSLAGAVFGAFAVTLLPEVLGDLENYRMIIFGSLVVLCMGLGHSGLAGLIGSGFRKWIYFRAAAPAADLQEVPQ